MNLDGLRGGQHDPLSVVRELAERSDRPISVIEIGTAYGEHLPQLAGSNVGRLCCIDPMYDWVPDVRPDQPFDPGLVCDDKVARWHVNAEASGIRPTLLIGRSWDVAIDPERRELLAGTDVLVVDGCHHPASAVAADYWAFEPLLADEHTAVFDDVGIPDVGEGYRLVCEALEASGSIVSKVDVQGIGVIHVRRWR